MSQAEQAGFSSHFDAAHFRDLPFGQLADVLLIEAEKVATECPPEHFAMKQVEAASVGLPTVREVTDEIACQLKTQNPLVTIDSLKRRVEAGMQSGRVRGRLWTDTDLKSALGKMCRAQSAVGIGVETGFIRQTAQEHLDHRPDYQLAILLALAKENDTESYQPGVEALQRRLDDPEKFDWQEAYDTFCLVLGCLENKRLGEKGVLVGLALEVLTEMKSYTDNQWLAVDYAVAVAHLSAVIRDMPSGATIDTAA